MNQNIESINQRLSMGRGNAQGGSEDVQKQFDLFVANGINIIHSEHVSQGFLERLSSGDDPIQTIAEITVDIVDRLYDSAKENNMILDHGVLIYGANVLMGEIITVAETAGMQKLNDEQKKKAYELAVSMYIDLAVRKGNLSKEELISMGNQVSQDKTRKPAEQMDQSGVQLQGGM